MKKLQSIFSAIRGKIILPEQLSEKQHKIVFILIFLAALALRMYGFGEYPAGFNQDEISTAYDSYADLVYGMDRNGHHNSVYVVSWGSGQFAGYNVVLRPFIKILGLNIITVRIPMLIFSIISLFFFYLLLKELFGAGTALLGLFLLALNPWHIMISRWGQDCNLAPLVFLPAVYFAVLSRKKPLYFILSMFLFACSGYGYPTVWMLFALFIPLMIWHVFRNKIVPVKYAVSGFLVFAVVLMPLALWMFINIFDLPAFKLLWMYIPRMTVLRSASTVSLDFVNNFKSLGNFFLASWDGDGWIANAIPPFGPYYPFMFVFMVFGAYILFVKNKGKANEMKFWLISAVAVALCIHINTNRVNMIFFPLIFLATIGIAQLQRHSKFVVPLLSALVIITTIGFASVYFTTFNRDNQDSYFNKYDHAIEYAIKNTAPDSTIYISGVNMPYIFALYAAKMPPQRFIDTVVYENPNAQFRHVVSFDRFVTAVPHSLNPGEAGVFHKNEVHNNLKNHSKKITAFGNFLVVEN